MEYWWGFLQIITGMNVPHSPSMRKDRQEQLQQAQLEKEGGVAV